MISLLRGRDGFAGRSRTSNPSQWNPNCIIHGIMRPVSLVVVLVLGFVLTSLVRASNDPVRAEMLSMSQALPMKGAVLVSIAELRSEALPMSVRNLLKKAIKLDENGRTSRAIEILDLALEEAPDFVQAHVAEAIGFLKMGQFARARSHTRMALELDPESIPARETMAAVELFDGNVIHARFGLEELLEVAPRRASTHELLGIALRRLGDETKSVEHLDLAGELRKHPPRPVYEDSGEYLFSFDGLFPFR